MNCLYDEVFRWDQHLHTICFRDSVRNGKLGPNAYLKNLCTMSGGSYRKVASFAELKHRMHMLAQHSGVQATVKIATTTLDSSQPVNLWFNQSAKIKKPTQTISSQQHVELAHRSNAEES